MSNLQVEDDRDLAPNQVLPVANLPHNFDGVPQDGMEYLFTVRRDAKTLPRFTRADNPYEVDEALLTTPCGAPTSQENEALPSEDWRVSFTRSFKNYRQNLKQAMNRSQDDIALVPLPSFQSRDAWWHYITGTTYMGGGVRQDDLSTAQETSTVGTVEAHMNEVSPAAKVIETSHEPTMSVLKQLSTKNVVQLLYWHSVWIDKFIEGQERLEQGRSLLTSPSRPLSPVHTRWMFTLLGILDDHLISYDISTLRSLARSCLQLVKMRGDAQQGLASTSESIDPTKSIDPSSGQRGGFGGYWIVFAAIANVWGQTDLWDEARQEFTKT